MSWFLLGFVLGLLSGSAGWALLSRPRRNLQESFVVSEKPPPISPTQYRQRTAGEEGRRTAVVRRLQIRQRRNDNPAR